MLANANLKRQILGNLCLHLNWNSSHHSERRLWAGDICERLRVDGQPLLSQFVGLIFSCWSAQSFKQLPLQSRILNHSKGNYRTVSQIDTIFCVLCLLTSLYTYGFSLLHSSSEHRWKIPKAQQYIRYFRKKLELCQKNSLAANKSLHFWQWSAQQMWGLHCAGLF